MNLADRGLLDRPAITGMCRSVQSVAARPMSVRMRIIFRTKKSTNSTATKTTTAPGMSWSLPAIQPLASMRNWVGAGSSVSKSLKISSNFGITKYMMPVTISTAMVMTTDRIDHRTLDATLESLGLLHEVGQTLEDDVEHAADLAGVDHLAVQPIEGLGILRHRLGERSPRLDVLDNQSEDVLELAALLLLLQDLKRTKKRQACVLERGELAGEEGELLLLDADRWRCRS